MADQYAVRVSIRISKKLHDEMLTLLPWGLKRAVHETVLRLILDAIRANGMVVAGAILDGRYKLVMIEQEKAQNLGGDS